MNALSREARGAFPSEAAQRANPRLRTVLVVTVGLAMFVTASVCVGLMIWREPAATSSGAEQASAVDEGADAGHLDESSRSAAIGDASIRFPGDPYALSPDPHQLKGVLNSVFSASAPVHERYDGHRTWSVAVLFGRLPAALNGDLEAQGQVTLRQLCDSIFDGHATRLSDVSTADHTIDGHAGVLVSGQVHYDVDGLPSRQDDVTVVLVGQDDGSVVVVASSVPDDAGPALVAQAAQTLASLQIR